MLNIIRSDLYRMIKSKGFYFFWLFIAVVYGITIFIKEPGGIVVGVSLNFLGDPAKLDMDQLTMSGNYYYFMIIPVFIFVISDLSQRTVKNTLSGVSGRTIYYLAKFILTELFAAVTFIFSCMAFYGLNRLFNGEEHTSPIADYSKLVLLQTPAIMVICSLFILIAFLLKRASAFNSTVLILNFANAIIVSVASALHWDKIAKILINIDTGYIFAKLVTGDTAYTRNCLIICVSVIAASFIVGYAVFKKSDIR